MTTVDQNLNQINSLLAVEQMLMDIALSSDSEIEDDGLTDPMDDIKCVYLLCQVFFWTRIILTFYAAIRRSHLQTLHQKVPEYYEGDVGLPIFVRISQNRKRIFSTEDIVTVILWPTLERKYTCKRVPVAVSHNVCFLVNTEELSDPQDILSDDMGAWKNNQVDSIHVKVAKTAEEITSVKRVQSNAKQTLHMYRLQRVYQVHRTDNTLKKS